MKSLLASLIFLIGCVITMKAQDPALTANDWFLQDLVINGNSNLPSTIAYITSDVELKFMDSGVDYVFDTAVCAGSEDITGTLSYPNSTFSAMTLQFAAVTTGLCCDTNPNGPMTTDQDCVDLINYSSTYANFWISDNPPVDFDYDIVSIANSLSLRITKANGDFALYGNTPLSLEDTKIVLDISMSINPVYNELILLGTDINEITELNIYSISGAPLLMKTFYDNAVDVTSLSSGVYFLKLTTAKSSTTLKFIKY